MPSTAAESAPPGRPLSALERAWQLKEACYAAWHVSPHDAVASAAELATLAVEHVAEPAIGALRDWTAGIAHLIGGDVESALRTLQAAESAFASLGDAAHAAQVCVPQMVALSLLGRDPEALSVGHRALAAFRAVGDETSAAKIELNVGTILSRQDRHDEAEAMYRQAAVHMARIGNAEFSILADVGTANALTWQARFDEALLMFRRCGARAQSRGFNVLVALHLQGMGRIFLARGQRAEALSSLSEASRLFTRVQAPLQQRLDAELELAEVYLELNLLDEALAVYTEVIGLARQGKLRTEAAWAAHQRAQVLMRMGLHERADVELSEARQGFESLGNEPCLARVLLSRGQFLLAARQDARQALEHAVAALARLGGTRIFGWKLQAQLLRAVALVHLGDLSAAREGFEQLLQQGEGLASVELQARLGLGQIAMLLNHHGEARQALESALMLIEADRQSLPDDEFRLGLGLAVEAIHDQLVRLTLLEGADEQLLVDVDRGRARSLLMSLGEPPTAVAAPRQSEELRWLRDQWRAANAEGAEERLGLLAGRIEALEKEWLETTRRERARQVKDAAAALAHLSVPRLQHALYPGQAMVVYHWDADELIAIVVRRGQVLRLSWPVPGLAAEIEQMQFQMGTLRFGQPALAPHLPLLTTRIRQRLQRLHHLVWAPLTTALGEADAVVVVPHRQLHYIPFAALHDGLQHLVERVALSLTPSPSAWLSGRERLTNVAGAVLALGAGHDGLPWVEQEVRAVVEAFAAADAPPVVCHRGDAATRAALFQQAPDARVVHLACHAEFRADNPLFSSLLLGDGRLCLHELRALQLRSELVVLSACETGVQRVRSGDEILGMVRTFMRAGSRSVLAARWPVDDQASAQLMGRFYKAYAEGTQAASALRSAQVEAARAGVHPYYWAGWVQYTLAPAALQQKEPAPVSSAAVVPL